MAGRGRHVRGGYGLPLLALSFLGAFAILVGTGAVDLKFIDPPGGATGEGELAVNRAGPGSTAEDQPAGCKVQWGQELRVALAAERALEDWRLHIDAMDELVAGDITVAQASALWSTSEQGALRRIDRFQRLDASLRQSPSACDLERSTADAENAACSRAARAVKRTIDTARTAVRTWKVHITDMDMLRDGEITGRQAEQKWKRLWRTGRVQTVRYDHRATGALAHHCP